MKILVIGGMHGNEPLGIDLVRRLQNEKLENVDAMYANQQAIREDKRFVKEDLNRSFPGSIKSSVYERRRAAELLKVCASYDIVLDFHNTYCPDNDCSFVGQAASDVLFDVSSTLGLKRVIVADYECINKYAPNCLSVEVSMTSPQNDVAVWTAKVKELAATSTIQAAETVQKYRFVYRMTLEDNEKFSLDGQGLRAFVPIPEALASKLGVISPAYPIFIKDTFTPYNYGGIINEL